MVQTMGQTELSITIQEKEAQKMIKSCSAACSPSLPTLMLNHLSTLQVLSIAMPNLIWTSFPPHSVSAPQQLHGRWQTRGNGAARCKEKLENESQMSTDRDMIVL